jgi:PIN domain nuclease of toxin-antitoxin system
MAAAPEKLPARARDVCEHAELTLSVASVWELAIKHEIGKLHLPAPIREFLDRQIRMSNVTLLPIHYRHALRAAALPDGHKDPFDRMIAAQSIEEEIPCITSDTKMEALGAIRIW